MDISTGADVSKKRTVPGVARNSSVINPAIRAIMATQPIFHSEFLPCVKVAGVSLKATTEILRMNPPRPAVTEFLLHVTAGKSQPWSIEPDALLVWTGDPDHHRGDVHDLAESRVEAARRFDRKIS